MLRSNYRARLWRALVVGAFAVGCQSDAATAPATREPLDLSADLRGEFESAILFAGELPVLGLANGHQRDQVAHAFTSIARQVRLDDRLGVERSILDARSAIERYQTLPDAGDAAIELAALAFTLDHASELARPAGSRRNRR